MPDNIAFELGAPNKEVETLEKNTDNKPQLTTIIMDDGVQTVDSDVCCSWSACCDVLGNRQGTFITTLRPLRSLLIKAQQVFRTFQLELERGIKTRRSSKETAFMAGGVAHSTHTLTSKRRGSAMELVGIVRQSSIGTEVKDSATDSLGPTIDESSLKERITRSCDTLEKLLAFIDKKTERRWWLREVINFLQMKSSRDFLSWYNFGIAACILPTIIILMTLSSGILISSKTYNLRDEIVARSEAFASKTQVIHAEVSEMARTLRIKRNYEGVTGEAKAAKGVLHKCSQCTRLHCPAGAMGEEGAAGNDGEPGHPGTSGTPGIDGEDIELDMQPELPCVICPGGPQGQRGPQGERGLSGKQGIKGAPGSPGKHGYEGPSGPTGFHGAAGNPGVRGVKGPHGDTVIAGEGIKGPRGLAGTQGPKGPPGISGRPSNIRGIPGAAGPQGPIGKTGKYGGYGERGSAGPPGEPGMPSTYCPSDCGVNTILTGINAPAAVKPDDINNAYGGDAAANQEQEESFDETSYRQFFGAKR